MIGIGLGWRARQDEKRSHDQARVWPDCQSRQHLRRRARVGVGPALIVPVLFPVLLLSVLLVVIAGCGGANYADENVALANRLLDSGSALEVIGRQDTTYCSRQSCRFGDDRVVTTYQVNVLVPIDDVVTAFFAAYPDFDVYHDECRAADCDGVDRISASQDSSLVYLVVYEGGTATLSADVAVPDEPTDTAD